MMFDMDMPILACVLDDVFDDKPIEDTSYQTYNYSTYITPDADYDDRDDDGIEFDADDDIEEEAIY